MRGQWYSMSWRFCRVVSERVFKACLSWAVAVRGWLGNGWHKSPQEVILGLILMSGPWLVMRKSL